MITEIFSPSSNKKIKIFNPKIPIVSTFQKRLELSHIEEMIEQLQGFPDFGYSANNISKDEIKLNGWNLLRDFLINKGKYERL